VLEQVLPGNNSCQFRCGRMDNQQVTQMHLSKQVQALSDLINSEHRHWVLNHVRSQVNPLVQVLLADLFHHVVVLQVKTQIVSPEMVPLQTFIPRSRRELLVIIVAREVHKSPAALKRIHQLVIPLSSDFLVDCALYSGLLSIFRLVILDVV
jgi:hypothetical protein